MRERKELVKWHFTKEVQGLPGEDASSFEEITTPHTWNAVDGMDGGSDYYRGECWYSTHLTREDLPEGKHHFLEIEAAGQSADVYFNGEKLTHHDGGYSLFRTELTDVREDNLLAIAVSNEANEEVYPQMADFTFYGGLYRHIYIVSVPEDHFELIKDGTPGIKVTPVCRESDYTLETEVWTASDRELLYTVYDGEGNEVISKRSNEKKETFSFDSVRRWNGVKDPYLYRAEVSLMDGDTVLDTVSSAFGWREYRLDPDKGFFLNGEHLPLRGVSRHQDRWGKGNALSDADHEEDMAIIREMGANTMRLAHYQHAQHFYDLCDREGLVIWAEIPYISRHMDGGFDNTVSQMTELITQNYNHPSIFFWGLSNEITVNGTGGRLLENHKTLNELCHRMDPTRLTSLAVVSMCDIHEPYIGIPDAIGYNHYFGWYGGKLGMYGGWFDNFHKELPNVPVSVTEYGCEGLNWHTSDPKSGDYTEEYQAVYHESLIKQLFPRPYIFATWCWNMFDFGADNRAEGGENGQNHKGLVTIDRKYKKDAFYIYKANLSDEKFVHLCSKRYIDRVEEETEVKVYSNCEEVELFVNGESLGKKKADDHIFRWTVKNEGESTLKAVSGELSDEGRIRKVSEMNQDYILREKNAILNWFDVVAPEGRLSLNETLEDVLRTFRGKLVILGMALTVFRKMKSGSGKKGGGGGGASMMKNAKGMMQMVSSFTILRLTSLLGTMNVFLTKEEVLKINRKLNRIRKK